MRSVGRGSGTKAHVWNVVGRQHFDAISSRLVRRLSLFEARSDRRRGPVERAVDGRSTWNFTGVINRFLSHGTVQCESKNIPEVFWHLLQFLVQVLRAYYMFQFTLDYIQVFIQLPATFTKLCHIKRDHPVKAKIDDVISTTCTLVLK